MTKFGTSLADKFLGLVIGSKTIDANQIKRLKEEKEKALADEIALANLFKEKDARIHGHFGIRSQLSLVPILTLFSIYKIPLDQVSKEQWQRAIEIYDPLDAYLNNESFSLDALKSRKSWDVLNLAMAIESKKTRVDLWFHPDYLMALGAAVHCTPNTALRDLWDQCGPKDENDFWIKKIKAVQI